jgi:hypothetical protein
MAGKKQKPNKPANDRGLSGMSLFELSIISVMPRDVYHEIKERIELALMSLESGTVDTARNILRNFFVNRSGGEP